MLGSGVSEAEVYEYVVDCLHTRRDDNFTDGTAKRNTTTNHFSLEMYLMGYENECDDWYAIHAGICKIMGLNYYAQLIEGDIRIVIILDGKNYIASEELEIAKFYNAEPTLSISLKY